MVILTLEILSQSANRRDLGWAYGTLIILFFSLCIYYAQEVVEFIREKFTSPSKTENQE